MNNFCRNCGTRLYEGQNFCKQCGKKITSEKVMQKETGQEEKNKIEQAVRQFIAGDKNAFEQLYMMTEKYIYYCIRQSGVEEHAIKDVMQETYLTIYNKIGDIQKPEAVLGWMKQIAFRKSVDHYRKNKREISYEDTSMEYELETEDSDSIMLPEDILVNREAQKLIRNMVNNLPEDQKRIIIAYYYCESKVDDIAQIMGMPSGTVKTKLSRARKQLKLLIEEIEGKQGIRLHSVTMAPILFYLFHTEAKAMSVPLELTEFIKTQVISKAYCNQIQNSVTQVSYNLSERAKDASAYIKGKVIKNIMIGLTAAGVTVGSALAAYTHFFSSTPEKTIATFEQAYNDSDINEMVFCMDEDSQDTYAQVEKVVGLLGITPQQMLDGVIDIGENLSGEEIPTINIKVETITYDGNYATAECSLERAEETETIRIQLIKENFKWHILFDDSDL